VEVQCNGGSFFFFFDNGRCIWLHSTVNIFNLTKATSSNEAHGSHERTHKKLRGLNPSIASTSMYCTKMFIATTSNA
jgi:hypothetical protein